MSSEEGESHTRSPTFEIYPTITRTQCPSSTTAIWHGRGTLLALVPIVFPVSKEASCPSSPRSKKPRLGRNVREFGWAFSDSGHLFADSGEFCFLESLVLF